MGRGGPHLSKVGDEGRDFAGHSAVVGGSTAVTVGPKDGHSSRDERQLPALRVQDGTTSLQHLTGREGGRKGGRER